MEAKTIGSFIAALRRANGMTQRDLADRLNVSDKTVSRWERDESAPDLTLIPVIAELFGITSDELLRGERTSASAQSSQEEPTPDDTGIYSAKAEKQRKHLIRITLTRHRNLSLTAAAVAGIGMIGAMILNTALTRAYLGFFIAAILYLAAVVCEVMIVNGTLSAVTEELTDEKELAEFRYRIYTDSRAVFVLTAVLFGACIPLLTVGDAYRGLTAETWLIWGTGFAVIAAVLCGVVLYFIESRLIADNIIAYPSKTAALILHRRRCKKNLTLLCIGLLAATAFLNGALTAFGSTHALADSIRFDDIESFIAFAEQDMQDTGIPASSANYDAGTGTVVAAVPDSAIYYDKNGNIITEELALTHTVEDSNGNLVFSFVRRNHTISSYSFGPESEGFLPIRVITSEQMRAAQRQITQTNAVFTVVYILELFCCLVVYFLRRSPKKSFPAA